MSNITPVSRRIIPFGGTIRAILRSFWYLRTILLTMALGILLTACLLQIVERSGSACGETHPPRNLAEAIQLCVGTVFSIPHGGIGATTILGRLLLVLDSLIGFMLIGVVVWVVQYCIGENALMVSQRLLFSSERLAKIK